MSAWEGLEGFKGEIGSGLLAEVEKSETKDEESCVCVSESCLVSL